MKNDQVPTGVNEDSTAGKLRFRSKHTKPSKPARARLELNLWPHDCLPCYVATYWLQEEGKAMPTAQRFAILAKPEPTSAKIISIKAA